MITTLVSLASMLAANASLASQAPRLPGPPLTITFGQLSCYFDIGTVPNSSWGAANVHMPATMALSYFNMSIDGRWVIANIAVVGGRSYYPGGPDNRTPPDQEFDFWLGTPEGIPVSMVHYGATLTPGTLSGPPPSTLTAPVSPRDYLNPSGYGGGKTKYNPPTPEKQGGAAAAATPITHDIPNMDCGENQCVPTACSMSVRYLNKKYSLGLNENEMNVQAMIQACGWTAQNWCVNGQWQNTKNNALSGKGITTSKLNAAKIADAYAAFKMGCDVEIEANSHCVCITSMTANADGTFTMTVNNDTTQGVGGKAHNQASETITVTDPATGLLKGPAWCNNFNITNLTTECKM